MSTYVTVFFFFLKLSFSKAFLTCLVFYVESCMLSSLIWLEFIFVNIGKQGDFFF